MSGVTLLPEALDQPALSVQGARNCRVSGIRFEGKNVLSQDMMAESRWSEFEDDWLLPALRRSGTSPGGLQRHSPYAALTIDAYSSVTPPSDKYPDVVYPTWIDPSHRGQYGKAFSSNVEITQCEFNRFAVGVVVQPASHFLPDGTGTGDGNGDFVRFRSCGFSEAVYGIAVANTQSRNVEIRDVNFALLHTFLTNSRFGKGLGLLGGPIDNVSGGAGYQVFDCDAVGHSAPVTVSSLYVENQVRIGSLGSGMTSFPNA